MEIAIILIMLLIVVAIGAIKLNDQGLAFPFKRNVNLFTPVERTFLNLIEDAVGSQYRVICRVRLADIVSIKKNADKKTAQAAATRATGRHLDFVLCSKDEMQPVLAIDLVHSSGEGYKNQRDWFVSGALDSARVPHVRIKVKSGYTVKDIRDCIESKLAPVKAKQVKPMQKPIVEGTLNRDPRAKELRPTRPIRTNKPVAA